jgi:hypothetical protein
MLLKGMKKRIMMLEQQLEYIKECSQWMKMNLTSKTPEGAPLCADQPPKTPVTYHARIAGPKTD